MSQTVGSFLREKLGNMGGWLAAELGTNHRVDYKQYIADRTDAELACLVGILHSNSEVVRQRDWDGLLSVADIPLEFRELLESVRAREDLHGKLWRYADLFIDVFSNS